MMLFLSIVKAKRLGYSFEKTSSFLRADNRSEWLVSYNGELVGVLQKNELFGDPSYISYKPGRHNEVQEMLIGSYGWKSILTLGE